MRHDGRIKQGCGLQRVFTGEKRADEQLPRGCERALSEHVGLHFRVVIQQQGFDIEMPGVKLCTHSLQLLLDLLFRQGKGTANDGDNALCAGGDEGADDHPCAIRQKRDLMATNLEGVHHGEDSGCSA